MKGRDKRRRAAKRRSRQQAIDGKQEKQAKAVFVDEAAYPAETAFRRRQASCLCGKCMACENPDVF